MTAIAINGLGRVGRTFLKVAMTRHELRVVAVNDLIDPENLVHLLRFDSAYRRYDQPVAYEPGVEPTLRVGRTRMRLVSEREPKRLPQKKHGVDIVIEPTGAFATFEQARAHITAGAERVVPTAPGKDADAGDARTVLVGVNEDQLDMSVLSSNGSRTTNSASLVMPVLEETIGVKKALLNNVHAYTASQSLVDGPARGKRLPQRPRCSSEHRPRVHGAGAAIAVARAVPTLRGRFDGMAMRVPVLTGSISSIVFLAGRRTSAEEINEQLEDASRQPHWSEMFAVSRGWDGHFTSRRRTPMATMSIKSGGGTVSTIGPDTIKHAFREIMDDEAKHVSFFEAALKKAGAPVRPKPTFKGLAQSNQSDFITMSGILENTGVAAFLMAMRAISDKKYVAAAESIATIEARHAGFVNALLAKPLSENGAFDKPTSHAEVVKAVSPFIESLNGGPDPADTLDNDTVILNFALLLEHLEAEFYRINVPKLFE